MKIITYKSEDIWNSDSDYFTTRNEGGGEIGEDIDDFGISLDDIQENGAPSIEKIRAAFAPLENYVDRLYVGWNGQISWVPKKEIYQMVVSHYLLNFGRWMPGYHVFVDLFDAQFPPSWKSFPPYSERPVYCQIGSHRMAIFKHERVLYAFVWTDQYPGGEWGVVTREDLTLTEQKTLPPAEFYQPGVNMDLLLAPLYEHRAF